MTVAIGATSRRCHPGEHALGVQEPGRDRRERIADGRSRSGARCPLVGALRVGAGQPGHWTECGWLAQPQARRGRPPPGCDQGTAVSRRKQGSALSGLAGLAAPGYGRHSHPLRGRGPYGGRRVGTGGVLSARAVVLVVVCAAVFAAVQFLRPAPAATIRATRTTFVTSGTPVSLPWPTQGSAALAVEGSGMVGSAGSGAAVPIASITKVMTALVVVHDHPLAAGQSGPTIGITAADVAQYQADLASQQSVVAVVAGEQITELQALEALLVPSGNNMAQVLAVWDRGSVAAFVAAMNARASGMGLRHTHFAGPSGLDPASVSTASDLVRLGEVAEANPVLASIVAMASVTLPVAGTVYNYDYELGHHGFVGVKTGSDGQAGGCFLFDATVRAGGSAPPAASASASAGGTTVHVIGAVLGQQSVPILQSALNASVALAGALGPQLQLRQIVAAGQQVAEVTTPWGGSAPVVAARPVTAEGWPGMRVEGEVSVRHLGSSVHRGQRVGTLAVDVGGTSRRIPLVAGAAVANPGFGWELANV